MQQNLQRMSNQLQAMQQEVRDLSQMTQQLAQQGMQQFQQLQNWGGQGNGQAQPAQNQNGQMQHDQFQLIRNEQASLQLLQHLTEVCQEMNQHLKNISQQMDNSRNRSNNMTFQPMNTKLGANPNTQNTNMQVFQNAGNQAGSPQQQAQVPEGPVNQDTTHPNNQSGAARIGTPASSQLLQGVSANSNLQAGTQNADNNTALNANFSQAQPMQQPQQTQNSGASNQNQSLSSSQVPTEADLKGNLNEYREDVPATQYPYNRYTT